MRYRRKRRFSMRPRRRGRGRSYKRRGVAGKRIGWRM